MDEKDFLPTRIEFTCNLLEKFIVEFFDQNPISQLGFLASRDGLADSITEMSGKILINFFLFSK